MRRSLFASVLIGGAVLAGCGGGDQEAAQTVDAPEPGPVVTSAAPVVKPKPVATAAAQKLVAAPKPQVTTAAPKPRATTAKPKPAPVAAPATDPDYGTCAEAKKHGNTPYYEGKDPEYEYYDDRDDDGMVCE